MKNLFKSNITQLDIQNYILFQFDILSHALNKFDYARLSQAANIIKKEFKRQSDLRKQIPSPIINMPCDKRYMKRPQVSI